MMLSVECSLYVWDNGSEMMVPGTRNVTNVKSEICNKRTRVGCTSPFSFRVPSHVAATAQPQTRKKMAATKEHEPTVEVCIHSREFRPGDVECDVRKTTCARFSGGSAGSFFFFFLACFFAIHPPFRVSKHTKELCIVLYSFAPRTDDFLISFSLCTPLTLFPAGHQRR